MNTTSCLVWASIAVATLIAPLPLARAGLPPAPSPTPRAGGYATVSPVIGDRSFIDRYGVLPDANTSEKLRVSTHHQYVETLLRSRDVSALSPELRAARALNLDRLRAYWQRGVYPANHDHPEGRFPCFIDRDGRICAVGYLVEQSAGRDVAERINSQFQYSTIAEMHSDILDKWIAGSGLTRDEVATIQPVYEPPPPPTRIGVSATGSIAFNPGFQASTFGGGPASHVDGSMGFGLGYGVHATFEKPLGSRRNSASLMVRAGYENRIVEFKGPGTGAYAAVPDRTEMIVPTYYTATTSYRRATADVLYSGGDERVLRYAFGVSAGFPLKGSRRETLTLDAADPGLQFSSGRYAGDGRSVIVKEDAFDDRAPVTIAVRAGLRLPTFRITRSFLGGFSMWYEYGITGLIRESPWRANALQLGFDVQYTL